jgi:putative ABC transport system substrate-binding protein
VAILTHASLELRLQALQSAATMLGVQLQPFSVEHFGGLEGAFSAMGAARVDVLKIVAGAGLDSESPQIAELAARYRLPALSEYPEFPRAGGLMAYGVNRLDIYHRAATYVDKILKGARPGDLPMERPMRFDFVVNLQTARELGVTFPNEIMLQVTEVIE